MNNAADVIGEMLEEVTQRFTDEDREAMRRAADAFVRVGTAIQSENGPLAQKIAGCDWQCAWQEITDADRAALADKMIACAESLGFASFDAAPANDVTEAPTPTSFGIDDCAVQIASLARAWAAMRST